MSDKTQAVSAAMPSQRTKLIFFAALVLAAFTLTYGYASARGADPSGGAAGGTGSSGLLAGAGGCQMSGGASGAGGGCCGGGGPAVEGSTTVEGSVQRISVDTSSGSFNPNVIKAKAGVPIEIQFSQAAGGCLSGVYFPQFNINEDLTGGGKTVTLPALDPGEYQFFCQMQMVSAKIVVE